MNGKNAGDIILVLFGIFLIFHLLVILGVIPYNIVWAGKINSRTEMLQMESVSILILVLSATLVALKVGYLDFITNRTFIKYSIWLLVVLFGLNTIGNFFAATALEKYGFGSLTAIITFLMVKLALS